MEYISCQCGEKLAKTSDFLYCEECDNCISFRDVCPDCGSATYRHNDPGYDLDTSYCLYSNRFISSITLTWADVNNPGTDRYQTCDEIVKENKEAILRINERMSASTPAQESKLESKESNDECVFCLLIGDNPDECPMCNKK